MMPRDALRSKKDLRFAGLTSKTLKAYRSALKSFLTFIKRTDVTMLKPSHLDRELSEFLNVSFQEGDPITYSGHLLSAIKRFYPELRLKLPRASQYYKNWVKCYHPRRATPASWELTEAMIGYCLTRKDPTAALLLGLGFDCMLRTAELMSLTHENVVIHRNGTALSVCLPHAKTSAGNPQAILVRDQHLVNLASSLKRRKGALWQGSSHTFRGYFEKILRGLKFPPGSYQPYALRRGGATFHFEQSKSIDFVTQRGRWSNSKTTRIYIDDGAFQLAHLCWTRQQVQAVKKYRLKGTTLRLHQMR